jgi:hypothetical protein
VITNLAVTLLAPGGGEVFPQPRQSDSKTHSLDLVRFAGGLQVGDEPLRMVS